VGASVAEAAVPSGTFKGRTSAKDPIGFDVNTRGAVVSFHYDDIRMDCTDDDHYNTRYRVETPANQTFRVSSKRRFHVKVRSKSLGSGWDAFGAFSKSGNAATGTLHVFERYNNTNNKDPKGDILCESKKLSFTAKRR
jgi:hypothetical protein